ncbi:MAG: type III pantothenate kinase [Mariniblastus sp.]
MRLIAVDIGNSSIKIAVDSPDMTDNWQTQLTLNCDSDLNQELQQLPLNNGSFFWSISSVHQKKELTLLDWIERHRPSDRSYLIEESDVDLLSNIESRQLLGRDRLISAWMAWQLNHTQGPVIVVDAGTAVTIDWVDSQGIFQGGVIFPGAESNFKRLNASTDALPDLGLNSGKSLSSQGFDSVIGKSTSDAIQKGVYHSQKYAILEIVKQMAKISTEPPVTFATGGGLKYFSEQLHQDWRYIPDLVLQGARAIGKKLNNT